MTDITTTNKSLLVPEIGDSLNTWGNSLNTTISRTDLALGGSLSKAITTSVTLTSTEAQNIGYKFTGSPGAARTITWPTFFGPLIVRNAVSDSSNLTLGMATGVSVQLHASDEAVIFSDGTDFILLSISSRSSVFAAPVTGATITAAVGDRRSLLKPAAGLATLSLVLPPNPFDDDMFELITTQTIASFSASAGAATVLGGTYSIQANSGPTWVYRAADTTWYVRY